MIVFFKVRNYKSIKDTLTLNFNSTGISEHVETNLIHKGRHDLLKSYVLYGHNGSGKSKILDALVFFRWFILNSAIEKHSSEEIDVEPFLLNEKTQEEPCFFEMSFYIDKTKYRYGFEATEKKVTKEWLLESKKIKEYPVFLRIEKEFKIDSKRFVNADGLEKRTRDNALFLSVCAQWNVKKAEKINSWFDNIFTVHGLSDIEYRDITLELLENDYHRELINRFIRKADLGINEVDTFEIKYDDIIKKIPKDLKESANERLKGKDHKAILMMHNIYNDKNEVVGSRPFILDKHESEGTKKFFNLLGVYISAIKNNSLIIMDEFDARLHTLLTKALLKLFGSEKIKSESQMIVACHDTAILDSSLLRRDQIGFVEKNKFGATELTSLVEYKPRKESPYDRNYLKGKYGGIPMIDDLEDLFAK
ncbi:AAA family ATPase [Christiangramia echinicola]|uniref:ATPase AAA-type core domain-containing protein n=1 Tax=Christiangramia echinicola TaxID=279359 RepID=A0A1H1LCU1_9FLAO|nr:ATP-binding protein [Christiangramia echinicola]SDR71835.1 hypothetical protein SAMN04488552_0685 [Christiangramia echinicola]